jgi:integrase
VHRYLQVRRALGYKLLVEGRMLTQFTAYLEENGHDYITTVTALAWAATPRNAAGCWWAARLSAVRSFARFAIAFDPRTEIPPTKLLARSTQDRLIPRIFTDREVRELMKAARALANPLRAAGIATLIGLMAATGMRSGEVMGLDRDDVDLAAGLITVRGTKFGKCRLVPLHPSTTAELERYRRTRDQLCPRPDTDAFILSSYGTRLNHTSVSKAIALVAKTAEIGPGPDGAPLRLYDLRHTFAVTTLARWYEQDRDVAHLLPSLSTYLGHVSPAATYWYLHACPQLMTAAAGRLESTWRKTP